MIRVNGANSKGAALVAEDIVLIPIEANKMALPKDGVFEITRENIGELPFHYLIDFAVERELFEIGDTNRVVKPSGPFKAAMQTANNVKLYVGISVENVSKIGPVDAACIEGAIDYIVYKNFPAGLFGEGGNNKKRVYFVDCFLPEERREGDKLEQMIKRILV